MKSEEYKKSVINCTKLIRSCWDENNPDDNSNFDERLQDKVKNLTGTEKEIMELIMIGD